MTHKHPSSLTRQLIVRAREIITDPAHWTKGALARTGDGRETWEGAEDVTCYCLMGALCRAEYEAQHHRGQSGACLANSYALDAVSRVVEELSGAPTINRFNDRPETQHMDVLAALDLTLERLPAE